MNSHPPALQMSPQPVRPQLRPSVSRLQLRVCVPV